MIVTRTFESITKKVTCCGNCPWMELVPEMGMGPLPTCMHNRHPGRGGYESVVPTNKIDERCPLIFKSELSKIGEGDLYKISDLLPQRPCYYSWDEPKGFKKLLDVWEKVTQYEKVTVPFKDGTLTVSPKDIFDELIRRGIIDGK